MRIPLWSIKEKESGSMRLKFFTCLLAAGALLASVPTFAQDVQTILSKVAAVYQNAKSYQAQASLTETRQMGGQQQKSTSTISTKYKAPNKLVTIVQGRESMQVYSDGKTMYLYFPEKKQYMKRSAPVSLAQQPGMSGIGSADPSQIGPQLQAIFGMDGKKLPDRNVGGKPVFVLQSTRSGQTPDGKGAFSMKATAFIDKATYMLRQITLEASQSQGAQKVAQIINFTVLSQQINPKLPDSVFTFKPPSGAKEIKAEGMPGTPGMPR
jgi:outer membrane lipoprotein-sorting protein